MDLRMVQLLLQATKCYQSRRPLIQDQGLPYLQMPGDNSWRSPRTLSCSAKTFRRRPRNGPARPPLPSSLIHWTGEAARDLMSKKSHRYGCGGAPVAASSAAATGAIITGGGASAGTFSFQPSIHVSGKGQQITIKGSNEAIL
jgi:hypothetical protein